MQAPVRSRLRATALTGLLAVTWLLRLTACADSPDPTEPEGGQRADYRPATTPLASAVGDVVLVGAADIAHCGANQGDEKTAAVINGLIASDPTINVYAGGDDAYPNGSAADFANCYNPSWGQFKGRTRPALGDNDYGTGTADPYFDYFGASAGERGKGYYSYDIGQWHIVVLNSNPGFVPTKAGSPQELWLQDDLAATSKPCILAYWQAPRFRSSTTSPLPAPKGYVRDFWLDLYAERADIVLNGDQHFYERFALQTPDGAPDPQNGIRQFIVGTGGKSVTNPTVIAPNSEVRDGSGFGVLKLTLGDGTYLWEFLPVAGATFTDTGSGTCHPKTPIGTMTLNAGNNQSATVGTNVAIKPSVKVTDVNGVPLANVAVTFTVGSGGGSGTGLTKTTTAAGIATVGSWKLGTVAGPNTMTARSSGLTGSPVTFTASATPGPANAGTSTATVPNGFVGSATTVIVQAKDQYGNNLTTGGAAVVVTVSGANSASPAVTDNGNGTYSASYTPSAAGSDQVAITLGGTAISGSPYTSTVTDGGTATTIALNAGNNQSAAAGTAVATPPSVKVTNSVGNPVEGVAVSFAVTAGGGIITGAAQTTDASGIATVGSWMLGTAAGSGNNTLTATSAGLTGSPVTFTASATPGPANAATSTATVPNGTVGSPTIIAVQAKDQHGNNLATGGAVVVVTVSGANSASPAVTDNGNGTYSAGYTPSAAGTDQVAITLDGTAISGSPYTSTVAGGTPTAIALDGGNNQSATVNTAVAIAPSVKVTDAGGNPVAGVPVSFAVTVGGGIITGPAQTTDANGIATVGSWTLGTQKGNNKLTATAAGLTGSPVTFLATGTAGAPTAIAINAGDNQTAPAGTTLPTRPAVKVTDTFGNGVPNITVIFAVASGGGSVTGASRTTGVGGVTTVGNWILGPVPGPNTLTATASGTGLDPVTFTATGT